jgi:tRNA A-37 threonylcarbamoyl transferase component Bud32
MLAGVESGFRGITAEQQSLVRWIAAEPRVRRELLAIARGERADTAALRRLVEPVLGSHGIENFALADTAGRILASSEGGLVGSVTTQYDAKAVGRLRAGEAVTRPPFAAPDVDAAGRPTGGTHAAALTAVGLFDDAGRFLGWFDVRFEPSAEFTPLLDGARAGATGEVLLLDSTGMLLSRSRFEEDLRRTGLLVRDPHVTSALEVRLRDPGGDLLAGHLAAAPAGRWPLTAGARRAIGGEPGVDVHGYRSYLGREVVGAWRWYPLAGIGVLAEQGFEEAYAPARLLRRAFLVLLALLLLSAAAVALGTHLLRRERARAVRAEQLGQYTLDKLVGEGAMGTVYRAHHALLRRPTAIKLLRDGRMTARGRGRFEREAQITSRLTHPNTVAVYDYGRSASGTLYLAMEFLQGLTVDEIVRRDGAIPERRVVHILKQVAGSLAEAHAQGLVHRDIKPQNVMVCHRGGVPDFVKVLDFGLVKDGPDSRDPQLTSEGAAVGTPLYMAPEAAQALEDVDVRADLYSLGVVAYYMLTGVHPFTGATAREVFRKHLEEAPRMPSDALGRALAPELEELVLRCLAKDRGMRPESAHALRCMLEEVVEPSLGAWTESEGDAWWRRHAPQHIVVSLESADAPRERLRVDLADRLPS